MSIFADIEDSVSSALKLVIEKNRKLALINRVKIVIRTENQNLQNAYAELGKYYYEKLRDPQNGDTEAHCVAADNANRRLARAMTRLEELMTESGCECGEDDVCCCEEEKAEEPCCCCEEEKAEEPCCCCEEAKAEEPCCCEEEKTGETEAEPKNVSCCTEEEEIGTAETEEWEPMAVMDPKEDQLDGDASAAVTEE